MLQLLGSAWLASGQLRHGALAKSKDQNASGDLGVYDMKTKTVTLTGNVVVSQGKNVVRGERVVVNTETGDARVVAVTARDRAESGVTGQDRVECSFNRPRTPRAHRRTPCPSSRRSIRIDR